MAENEAAKCTYNTSFWEHAGTVGEYCMHRTKDKGKDVPVLLLQLSTTP